jgi:hypothetical protein
MGSLLLGWWLGSQVGELCLLLGGQFVFDSYQQGHLLPLHFAFGGQGLFQLGENLLLVYARLFDQGDELLHFILQLPLQLREFQRDSSLRYPAHKKLCAGKSRVASFGMTVWRGNLRRG